MCVINVLFLKTAVLFDYNIVKMTSDNRKITICHVTRTSVTRNCQIYSMQLDTLKMGFLNLKNSLILS